MKNKIPILSVYDENGNRLEIPAIVGRSAYQDAVHRGYQGSVDDWLKSLRGEKGDPGENYNLTETDKEEIAGMISSGGAAGNVWIIVGGTSLNTLRIEFVSPPAGVSVDAAYELIGRGMFDVAVQIHTDDNDIVGAGLLRGITTGDGVGAIGEFWSQSNVSLVQVWLDFGAMTAEAEVMYTSSGGGGGVVIITQDADGSYTCSHTATEIAEMAFSGAVVAVVVADDSVITAPLVGISTELAVFKSDVMDDDTVGMVLYAVTDDGVMFADTIHRVAPMTGASAADGGGSGTVPAPAAGQQDAVLHGDGTWRQVAGGTSVESDGKEIEMLIAADLLPAVTTVSGAILTNNSGNVILRY